MNFTWQIFKFLAKLVIFLGSVGIVFAAGMAYVHLQNDRSPSHGSGQSGMDMYAGNEPRNNAAEQRFDSDAGETASVPDEAPHEPSSPLDKARDLAEHVEGVVDELTDTVAQMSPDGTPGSTERRSVSSDYEALRQRLRKTADGAHPPSRPQPKPPPPAAKSPPPKAQETPDAPDYEDLKKRLRAATGRN